jgi:hypothetical protein
MTEITLTQEYKVTAVMGIARGIGIGSTLDDAKDQAQLELTSSIDKCKKRGYFKSDIKFDSGEVFDEYIFEDGFTIYISKECNDEYPCSHRVFYDVDGLAKTENGKHIWKLFFSRKVKVPRHFGYGSGVYSNVHGC